MDFFEVMKLFNLTWRPEFSSYLYETSGQCIKYLWLLILQIWAQSVKFCRNGSDFSTKITAKNIAKKNPKNSKKSNNDPIDLKLKQSIEDALYKHVVKDQINRIRIVATAAVQRYEKWRKMRKFQKITKNALETTFFNRSSSFLDR